MLLFNFLLTKIVFKGALREKNKHLKVYNTLCFLLFMSTYCSNSSDAPFMEPIRKASMIIFSYDRPAQLAALLESIQTHITNLNDIYIIYRASQDYEQAYTECFNSFKDLQLTLMKQGPKPNEDFKPLVMQALASCKEEYMLFTVDDLLITDKINLSECINFIIKYQAYAFFLRLGENITESFMIGIQNPMPLESLLLDDKVYFWKFEKGYGEWAYPHSVDGNIYPTRFVIESLQEFDFVSPNTLEGAWADPGRIRPYLKEYGLCYRESKLINIPFNAVKNDWPLYYPVASIPTIEHCLQKFIEGYRVDINPYFRLKNKSPHVDPRTIELYWRKEETN